jgi:Ubiquitin-2 like Rad60 SUMO-like
MSDHDGSPGGPLPAEMPQPPSEHLNIKVTDGNNEVFFKIKRSTKLEKLMNAFCERQGKQINTVRFLFDGQRVQPTDSPDTVSPRILHNPQPLHHTLVALGGVPWGVSIFPFTILFRNSWFDWMLTLTLA